MWSHIQSRGTAHQLQWKLCPLSPMVYPYQYLTSWAAWVLSTPDYYPPLTISLEANSFNLITAYTIFTIWYSGKKKIWKTDKLHYRGTSKGYLLMWRKNKWPVNLAWSHAEGRELENVALLVFRWVDGASWWDDSYWFSSPNSGSFLSQSWVSVL